MLQHQFQTRFIQEQQTLQKRHVQGMYIHMYAHVCEGVWCECVETIQTMEKLSLPLLDAVTYRHTTALTFENLFHVLCQAALALEQQIQSQPQRMVDGSEAWQLLKQQQAQEAQQMTTNYQQQFAIAQQQLMQMTQLQAQGIEAKETYYRGKRDLKWQKRPNIEAKETYRGQRDLP